MEGGDKLSMDICDDYSSTAQFYITSKGVSIDDGSPADFNDWAIVDIQNIKYDEGADKEEVEVMTLMIVQANIRM